MPDDSELTIAEAAKRLQTSTSKVRRLIHTKKLPASFRSKDGKLRYVINRRDLDRYHDSGGQKSRKQLSLERTLATFMSIQPPIAEKRLSEIGTLDSERRSPLRDPDRDFDHLFQEMFGWGLDGKEDRRRLYKEWLERDGDLAFLTWIEAVLEHGDRLVESLREDLRARGAKLTKELQDFVNSPFMDYVGGWIVAKTAQSTRDSLLSSERLEKTADSAIQEACRQAFMWHLYKQERAQKGLRDILLNGIPGFVPSSPLRELLWEYAVAPELNRTEKGGNLPDYWGTFILMALTQHLRGDNERAQRNPHYTLCSNLLDLFRADRGKKSVGPKKSDSLGQTKIQQLQDSHPDWPQHLSSLRQAFLSFLDNLPSINLPRG